MSSRAGELGGRAPGMGAPLRVTRQRLAVSTVLAELDEFRSAQQIHELLRQRGDKVGLATVYRALQAMADIGEIDVLRTDDGEALYRLCSSGRHHHLVCRSCGSTVEVEGSAVERWTGKIRAGARVRRRLAHVGGLRRLQRLLRSNLDPRPCHDIQVTSGPVRL